MKRNKQILIEPLITERTMQDASLGRFTFKTDMSANKQLISSEVAEVFKVHPIKISTMIVKGTMKRSMRTRKSFQSSPYKKAVVTLKQGEKIDLFDVTEKGVPS